MKRSFIYYDKNLEQTIILEFMSESTFDELRAEHYPDINTVVLSDKLWREFNRVKEPSKIKKFMEKYVKVKNGVPDFLKQKLQKVQEHYATNENPGFGCNYNIR